MKKFTLLFISFLAVQVLLSQPVLTNSLNFTIGDTYRYDMYHEVTNIEPGPGGANLVWDFGNVTGATYIEGEGGICVDPSTTAFADSAAVANATMCLRNEETPDNSPYQYMESNNTSQNLIAMGFLAGGSANFTTYTNPQTVIEYPFTYGDSFDDTWELLMYSIDLGYYFNRDSAIVTAEADAYGTITTPVGVFQNALRIKTTTTDYSWTNYGGTGWISNGSFTDVSYQWYAPNIKTPVMTIGEMEWLPGYMVSYLVEHNFSTGIEDRADYYLEVFPNPATDKVTIKTDKIFNRVSIYSLNGGQMFVANSQTGQAHQKTIDFSQYPKGIYLIEVVFEDGSVVRERIIKQ